MAEKRLHLWQQRGEVGLQVLPAPRAHERPRRVPEVHRAVVHKVGVARRRLRKLHASADLLDGCSDSFDELGVLAAACREAQKAALDEVHLCSDVGGACRGFV